MKTIKENQQETKLSKQESESQTSNDVSYSMNKSKEGDGLLKDENDDVHDFQTVRIMPKSNEGKSQDESSDRTEKLTDRNDDAFD